MPTRIKDNDTFGGMIFRAPDRADGGRDLAEAYRCFRKLLADKEDTVQVFKIGRALSGRYFETDLRKRLALGGDTDAVHRHESLIPYLDNHPALAELPDGTLGRAYLHFMQSEGLTAAGLEAEERRANVPQHDDLIQWHYDRLRDLHDLIHVFTGYSRGALGELCNLAWTYGNNRGGFGDAFIAVLGVVEMKRWFPRQPLFRALYEAWANGRKARYFYLDNIPALFAMPLAEAKEHLGVRPAPFYEQARTAIVSMTEDDNNASPYATVANG
ncbi:MAG: hypothetical protein HRU11_07810 [Parvularculaceae bacterium]|nr:hypothetical protein [Parvularculaceae bacterium]